MKSVYNALSADKSIFNNTYVREGYSMPTIFVSVFVSVAVLAKVCNLGLVHNIENNTDIFSVHCVGYLSLAFQNRITASATHYVMIFFQLLVQLGSLKNK